jgi:ABC-type transport system involved in multi-copper enzyme maturation permease subunit
MKLREIIRYEVWHQARRPTTWIFLGALTAFAFHLTSLEIARTAGGDTPVNTPYVLASIMSTVAVLALLPIVVIAGEAAGRDVMSRMTPLLYTAPVPKAAYLGGRFAAALLLAAVVSLAVPAGTLLAVVLSSAAPEVLGPLRPACYASAWLGMGLPNAVVATCLAFALATFARRPMAGWVAAALLVTGSLLCVMLLSVWPGQWWLASLLDPLGLTPLREISQAWTPNAKRTEVPWLAASYLRNRALWLGAGAAVLAFTHHRFRLEHHVPPRWWTRGPARGEAPADPAPRAARPPGTPAPRAARRPRGFGPGTHVRQLAALARESWRVVVLGGGGAAMLLAAVLVVVVAPGEVSANGLPIAPATALLADSIANPFAPFTGMALLLILFYAGELVWRDREAGLGEIAGAAPVPEWAHILGRAGGLALAMATFQAVLMVAAMAAQLRVGYRPIEPWLHARLFLGMHLADYLLLVALAIVVHVVVAHKYLGHLAMLLAYGFVFFAGQLGVEHRLLVFAADPGWSYSDMRGFGGSVLPWLILQLYWGAWTALLLVGASLLWVRGREDGVAARLRMARRRTTRRAAGAASCAAALVLALGGFTFYNTNVLHEYLTGDAAAARSAQYERRYGRFTRAPQPRLEGVRLHAELHPERGRAEIRGTYRLVNRGSVAIESIHVTTNPDVVTRAMTLDRPATPAVSDERLGYRVFALRTPLQPGDSLRLGWVVRVGKRGFANDGVAQLVTANGTYIRNFELPWIGYQEWREVRGAGGRREHGLPGKPAWASLDDDAASHDMRLDAERMMVEATIGTSAEQHAVGPGTLRRKWTENGRRYFQYATERPIRSDFALFSARYAVRTARWPGAGHPVQMEVVHHPGHATNVDRMLAGMRASLGYLSAKLGPYPHRQLRLVEYPGTGGLHAAPINVSFQEGVALFDPGRDPRGFDFAFAIVAHELAHQWWGNQLTPARVEGAHVMSESLAWYSAMGVVEHARGREELGRMVAYMREAWLPPRAPSDPPLLRATEWFHGYRKGPLALYALREYVGAGQVDVALRRLLAAHADARPPLPTTRDLYRELQEVTPDTLRPLLHDLFAANTLWELAAEQVSAVPAPGGMVRLALAVSARKIVVDTAGAVREVPMNDLVEIGAFADGSGDEPGAPVYRRWHRIRSGAQRLTITVPAAATWAGVDPRSLLFDLVPGDNVARL